MKLLIQIANLKNTAIFGADIKRCIMSTLGRPLVLTDQHQTLPRSTVPKYVVFPFNSDKFVHNAKTSREIL